MNTLRSRTEPDAETRSTVEVIRRARCVQPIVAAWSQDRIDDVVLAVAWHAFNDAEAQRLSNMAVRETGFGSFEDTYARHRQRILGVMRDLEHAKTEGVIESCPELGLRKIAKPIGVIAAMTPSTAPVAAVVVNALAMLKTRNAVIFCPNPGARYTVFETIGVLRTALNQVGAPCDIIQCVTDLSRERVTQLMEAADLVVASGGQGTVRRAYLSGTPAYGAGTGNAVVLVDETADITEAAPKIIAGKSFDNGTSCSSESSLVLAAAIYDGMIDELEANGAHLCNPDEAGRLRATAWPDGRSVSRKVVGKNAETIARLAGLSVATNTRVLMLPGDNSTGRDPVSGEKLSPILGLWRYDGEIDKGIEMVRRLTSVSGPGHSCGIYSHSSDHILRLGALANVSRMMVNQSTGFGNSGSFDNGMPVSVVLSCGSWGGSSTSENINWRHFLNYTWISEPIARAAPDPNRLFERHWARYGK
ncbi:MULTISPECIES: aldehyde dehydrogenase family protein [unclassified Bradyrhizobium]|uniref:aldehyde dehydrogenase family protein n=1 Tax=unclassified Bradyrhizobium TaxID=2631580 RepID=UPI001FF78004|nr:MULTISPECIES: aldehyde dehydrogenase family protein [unclassified Bradyrhizobium]MCK1420542.1 aldehyde dehydrogenase family protein [Bradyrhizobium sp. CW12]MCK1646770.1 aldehyde dehydrogenase family protein [Bradyrhizobium sp. 154]